MSDLTPLLSVDRLSVELSLPQGGVVRPVRDVSFELARGQALGIVGESGSGKSMAMLALMGLLPHNAQRSATRLTLGETDLLALPDAQFARQVAGKRIGMIFQEPMTSLNPVYSIGRQLTETMTLHGQATARVARGRALELLERVGVPEPELRLRQYPHQLSGGLRQRVMIAMALMNSPELIIADEPTTALDVTIKAQILDLLAELRKELGTAMILVSHDIAAVSRAVDRVGVMYAGTFVEQGPLDAVLGAPLHPYTQGLLRCAPRALAPRGGGRLGSIAGSVPRPFARLSRCGFVDRCPLAHDACRDGEPGMSAADDQRYRCVLGADRLRDFDWADTTAAAASDGSAEDASRHPAANDMPVLSLESVSCEFITRRGVFGRAHRLRAVDDATLGLHRGEILAVVGESGSGKTTMARMLLGLQNPTDGIVRFEGRPLADTGARERARRIQPVFQDPYSSLNPLRTVADAIGRPLVVHGIGDARTRRERVREVMDLVGLDARFHDSYPGQMSGGQRQRVAVARALALEPEVLVCDEPTSALDISVQAQILNLLLDLQARLNLTYFIITHDLAVVRYMASRVAVMQRGRIVERGPTERVYTAPEHAYTRELLASMTDAPGDRSAAGAAPA
ncbi:ABC transporter ATP-binding protein [Salinisphaera sp. T31B1]|uniref:ABC transporter ATP-binding protein n=1 Tax=Salinisphaera sp. T31B1 TaxID=727963 RepID=UPI003341CF83